jgi:hypothetical protein
VWQQEKQWFLTVTSKWYVHDGQENVQQQGQTVNFTNNFDPYAAICMSYYENEDLCSYHKNISCQMLIQSKRHIKEGHLIYRWMQIYPPDTVLLFGCSTNRSMPQLQNERNILWLMKVSMMLPHEWVQNSWYDSDWIWSYYYYQHIL